MWFVDKLGPARPAAQGAMSNGAARGPAPSQKAAPQAAKSAPQKAAPAPEPEKKKKKGWF